MRITMEPAGARWEGLLRGYWNARDGARLQARRAAGLPTDAPIVMTGHQAELWHPGILVKFIAAQELAARASGAAAWLIVDQDDNEALTLRVPVRTPGGALSAERLALGGLEARGVPTGARPPATRISATLDAPAALESADRGAKEIAGAVRAAGGRPTLARQTVEALRSLASPWLESAPLLFATDLHANPTFRDLVERMREGPRRAVEAYNRAAEDVFDAGITPLEIAGNRIELPLWRIRPGMPRERVHADELDSVPPGELAPRALLATAIVRLCLCDLFIHGTGGAAYDRVTERWIEVWLGRSMAPTVMATADLLLPLDEADVEESDLARAVWAAHHARHDPTMVGLDGMARERAALVKQIEAAKHAGEDPAPPFHRLQDFLAKYRTDERARLDTLEAEVTRLRRSLASRDVARDRTWAFPLHDRAAIDALRAATAEQIRAHDAKPCCC